MTNKNSQIFVHPSGLCMYSVHHQCNKHNGWIIAVFWCIVVCGRKISYRDTYFSILVYQLDWLGSDFLYGLSIPNFFFPKAKHVDICSFNILNTEFEVRPVAVVIIYPCRLTQSVKTFISYSYCKFINCCCLLVLFSYSTKSVDCLTSIVQNVPKNE